MTSGVRQDRDRARRLVRRWLPVALLAAAALLGMLWVEGTLGPEDGARETAAEEARRAALLPVGADAGAGPAPLDAGDDARPESVALAPLHASLVVRVEETGVLADTPTLVLSSGRGADSKQLGARMEVSWAELPPDTYMLQVLSDGWTLEETDFTLAPREARTVHLVPRRTAAVRVVGGLSGRPMLATGVQVRLRTDAELQYGEPFESMRLAEPAARFALLGLVSSVSGDRPVREFQVQAEVRGSWASSEWLPLAALEDSPVVTVRAPEVAITGQLSREDGAPPHSRGVNVLLWPADGAGQATVPGADARLVLGGSSPIPSARVDARGRYELRLSTLPAGPVRVVTWSEQDLRADSGPLTLSAANVPLTVDLVVPRSARVQGHVRVAAAPDEFGQREPIFDLASVRARRLPAQLFAPGKSGVPWEPVNDGDAAFLPFEIGGLAPGEYEVEALIVPLAAFADRPARRLVQRISVPEHGLVRADFDADALPPGPTVRGSLLLPPDLRGATGSVTLVPAEAALARRETAVGADGRYAIADVAAGTYEVQVSGFRAGNHSAAGRTTVVVEDRDLLVPPLDLARPALVLQVAAESKALLLVAKRGELSMTVTDEAARQSWRVPADRTGLAQLYGLPPGRYSARASSSAAVEFDVGAADSLVTVLLR